MSLLCTFPPFSKAQVYFWGLPILGYEVEGSWIVRLTFMYLKTPPKPAPTMAHAEYGSIYWLNSLSKIMFLTIAAKPHRSNPNTGQEEIVCKLVRSTKMANIFVLILRHQALAKQNLEDKLLCWLGKFAKIQFMNSWCVKMDEVTQRQDSLAERNDKGHGNSGFLLRLLLKTYLRVVKTLKHEKNLLSKSAHSLHQLNLWYVFSIMHLNFNLHL